VNTKINRAGHPVNLITHKFPKAYRGMLPIALKKLQDLLSFCEGPNPIVPLEKQAFYRTLKSCKSVTDDYHC
jgi:hypothetical protein